jgi:hypothetical protein
MNDLPKDTEWEKISGMLKHEHPDLDIGKYNWSGPLTLDGDDPRLPKKIKPESKEDIRRFSFMKEIPPLVLINKGKYFDVLDGEHRLASARTTRRPIKAYVGKPIQEPTNTSFLKMM